MKPLNAPSRKLLEDVYGNRLAPQPKKGNTMRFLTTTLVAAAGATLAVALPTAGVIALVCLLSGFVLGALVMR